MRPAIRRLIPTAALVLILAACNYPGVSAPTPFQFPTANATLTAVFEPSATAPGLPTAGALPTQPGSGPAPTAETPPSATVQPTAELVPTNTSQPPAPTAAPTNTPAATATRSVPSSRGGPSIRASYLGSAPNIDGNFDEWEALDRYRITDVVFGSRNYSGEEDLSARAVMFGWDEDNLYLAVRVIDDRYVQNASGEDLFLGDSLEILMDTNLRGDYYVDSLSPDDFQLGISAGSPNPGDDPEAYLWYPSNLEGSRSRVQIGAKYVDAGYRVEVAIPWSTFEIEPASGMNLGFALSISDNDNPNENEQQSMVSTAPNRVLTDPTTWADLTLVR